MQTSPANIRWPMTIVFLIRREALNLIIILNENPALT